MTCESVDVHDGGDPKSFEELDDLELEAALAIADACCEPWRRKTYAERAVVLDRASAIMMDRLEPFALTMARESGQPLSHCRGEVALCARIIDYYARSGVEFLPKGRLGLAARDPNDGDRASGILFAVEPWNLPYYQLTRFAAPNLMAGSVVVVKHAERVPQCGEDFASLWVEAGALPGAFTKLFISSDQVIRVIEDSRVRGVALIGPVNALKQLGQGVRGLSRASSMVQEAARLNRPPDDPQVDRTIRSAVWGDLPGYFGPSIS